MSCVIVLGCFRSGTSAVAGILHHLGVFMGDPFDEPNRNNPNGFYEDLDFKRLHVYFEEGRDTDDLYENLIYFRERDHVLWGVKDPLLCKYLGKLTSFLSTDHKLIVCRRPTEEIAKSMTKAVGPNAHGEDGYLVFEPLAKHYVEAMEGSLAGYKGPVLEVHYREIGPEMVEQIAKFVELPVTEEAIAHVTEKPRSP